MSSSRRDGYSWRARLRYRLTRFFKDAWAAVDRRPRVTELDSLVYLGGQLTPERTAFLRDRRVRAMVSLQEEALDSFAELDAHLWLPSLDGRPPSDEQLRFGARFIAAQHLRGRPVYAHCHAGVGRAPTLCGAFLVMKGVRPDAALRRIKELRPWISMNASQMAAVRRFAGSSVDFSANGAVDSGDGAKGG